MINSNPFDFLMNSFTIEWWMMWHMDWDPNVNGRTAGQFVAQKVGAAVNFQIYYDVSTLAVNDEMVVHLGGSELELDLT